MEKEQLREQLEQCKDDIDMLLWCLEDKSEKRYQITDQYIETFNPTESLKEVIQSMREYFG